MNKCRDPEHPHCTVWVMPGDPVCAHGHPQPENLQPGRAELAIAPVAVQVERAPLPVRPHLHVSGFDPRACGGRYSIRLDLRGMPPGLPPQLMLRAQSALPLHTRAPLHFSRTRSGGWRAVFIEFSSRAVEHGQHRIDLELQGGERNWVATLVLNLPRRDATLADIHAAFLASHKNVHISADDASIARVSARTFGRLDIEVNARDASIAQLDLQAEPGKADVGIVTIAWDEDLVEVDAVRAPPHPCPASAACLTSADPVAGLPQHIRLLALDEFVLGRFETDDPEADVLLSHFTADGADPAGLTRRLSARHAVIRRVRDRYEIEDVSRYGLLLDGSWPGKHVPVPLRLGMIIELTASIRGVVRLVVSGLLHNGVVLHREDDGADAECFCLLEPDRRPAPLAAQRTLPQAARLPLLFHDRGGFWCHDAEQDQDEALTQADLSGPAGQMRFAVGAYPVQWTVRASRDRREPRFAEPPAGA
ncbi:FHA domain-containing protein [Massilia horti]|uniref:FHA domain-containing protein n=2 Tax=Massilia horti TaxID=2562153 RepID=A0A4Y9T303_9BURK|nr:FHA domain-containing protein [Massilia horti]